MTTLQAKKNDLDEQWRHMNGSNKQKASLFNLIIYTHEERRVPYFRELVDTVIDKFPCRIIFIKGNTYKDEDEFKTDVSLKSSGSIVCDHIEIHAGGTHLDQVPYYILPHLEPDLPIYLVWGQDPTSENEVLPRLVEYADRLIFDSECTGNLQNFCGQIADNLDKFPCQILDMNWARLAGWRYAMIEALDSQERIEQLQGSKEITITYNDRKTEAFQHNQIQADYLQGWLATRLGWKFSSSAQNEQELRLSYKVQNRDVLIRIQAINSNAYNPGSITHVHIATYDEHVFDFQRPDEQPGVVIVNISSQDKCWLPFNLSIPTQSKGSSFIQQLFYSHPSHHYIDMLKTLSKETLS